MSLSIRWDHGIAVKYKDAQIIFDPQINNPTYPNVFITHAHSDHSKGFSFLNQTKFSTQETLDLVKAIKRREISNWKPVQYHRKVKIGEIEVEAHNAGHILGSAMYEVISPEGNLVYTGDLNFTDTLTTRAADVVPCDTLVMEATFGSPNCIFPPHEWVTEDIIKWALDSIKRKKIPTFQADSLGNAQELIRIFNKLTKIPVITHASVTRMNKVYEAHGHILEYLDAGSEEAAELVPSGEHVFVAPKRLKGLSENPQFNVAYVSGWALRFKGKKRKPFILSDHADCDQLLEFVKESRPKLVLLCYGRKYNTIFGRLVNEKLGIEARPLGLIPTTIIPQNESARIEACEREILRIVKIPGFVYSRKWIRNQVSCSFKRFTTAEIYEALDRLTRKGYLRIMHKDRFESR